MDNAAVIANVIAGGLFALTAVAAIVAIVQAKIASDSRKDAQDARDEAKDHERAALTAAQKAADAAEASVAETKRLADAQEEANALVRAQLTPVPLWVVTHEGGDEYALVSNMGRVAQWVYIEAWGNSGAITMLDPSPDHLVRFGDKVRFRRERRLGASSAVTLIVNWQDVDNVDYRVEIDLP